MTRRSTALLQATLLGAVLGCSATADPVPDPLEESLDLVDVPDRVSVGPVWDDPRTGRLLWALGSLDGPPETIFGRITGFDVDTLGRIYVLDGQASRVTVFDSERRLLGQWGRRGDGPEDLYSASSLNVHGWQVSIWESVHDLFKVFTIDGDLTNTVPWDFSGFVPGAPNFLLDDGSYLALAYSRDFIADGVRSDEVPSTSNDFDRHESYSLLTRDSGPAVDTLVQIEIVTPGAGLLPGRLTGTPVWSRPVAGSIWLGWGTRYTIYELDLTTGRVLRALRRDMNTVRPLPVRPAYADSVMQGEGFDSRYLPDLEPLVGKLAADSDHLVVFTRESTHEYGTAVDVFRLSDGAYLGNVSLPADIFTAPGPILRDGVLYGLSIAPAGYATIVAIDLGLDRDVVGGPQ